MRPPPKKLGRGGDGWVTERDGIEGVAGLAGDAGLEYEREPRLPPPPARAHTLAVSVSSNETSVTPIRGTSARDLIGHTSGPILRYEMWKSSRQEVRSSPSRALS